MDAADKVTQVILDVSAINEGEWGNNLRVQEASAGRVVTATVNVLPADKTEVKLASLDGIRVGMTLFISDNANAARVQVTQINETVDSISFVEFDRTTTNDPIDIGAAVTGILPGKVSTLLDADADQGASEVLLLSPTGIRTGSVLLFEPDLVQRPAAKPARAVVKRVAGKRVFLEGALAEEFKSGDSISAEDFTLTAGRKRRSSPCPTWNDTAGWKRSPGSTARSTRLRSRNSSRSS